MCMVQHVSFNFSDQCSHILQSYKFIKKSEVKHVKKNIRFIFFTNFPSVLLINKIVEDDLQ